jgi:23S rRNA G2445 N2-methylase RlmL
METIVAAEIKESVKSANNMRCVRGKVVFDCNAQNLDYSGMRCIDNLFKLLCTFKIGGHKSDLKELGKNIAAIDFESHSARPQRVIVSASRSGRHAYSRFDAAIEAERGLTSAGGFIPGDAANHDLAVRIDITDEICAVYKQLSSARLRFRGNDFQTMPGGIRPSAAHCLIKLSSPGNNDVFYDPFCGAGTIPFERSYYKSKKIFASDISMTAVTAARTNLEQSAVVFKADAVNSTMKDKSVSTVVTNIPWGKQIAVPDAEALYYQFIKELCRILTVDGKALILTDQRDLIHKAGVENGMNVVQIGEMSLHGLHPFVYQIFRP